MFVHRTCGYPAPGQEREFVTVAEEVVRALQVKGMEINLCRQLFAPEGPTLVAEARFRDLTEYEKRVRENQADQEFQDAQARLGMLSRRPLRTELLQIVVPFQK